MSEKLHNLIVDCLTYIKYWRSGFYNNIIRCRLKTHKNWPQEKNQVIVFGQWEIISSKNGDQEKEGRKIRRISCQWKGKCPKETSAQDCSEFYSKDHGMLISAISFNIVLVSMIKMRFHKIYHIKYQQLCWSNKRRVTKGHVHI